MAILAILACSSFAAAQEELPLGGLLGDKGSLTADTQNFQFKDNEIVSMTFSEKVRLRSEKIDLDCDVLTYDDKTGRLSAAGQPVRLESKADNILARCRKLVFEVEENRMVLTGDPVIERGNTVTGGEKIILVEEPNGMMSFSVQGSTEFQWNQESPENMGNPSGPRAPAAPRRNPARVEMRPREEREESSPAATPEPTPARRIDENNLEMIPENNVEEE